MIFKSRKRIAASLLKRSPKRVRLDPKEMDEIKEALTKADIRGLINDGVIKGVQKKGVSRARARMRHLKKRKGQVSGAGKRKGKSKARAPKKEKWMNRIRLQRGFLRELREKNMITTKTYRELYLKAKGGFFRSKRHLTIYINEHNLVNKDGKKKSV